MTVATATNKMVSLTIDGRDVSVPEGTTLSDAAASAGISIPVLCHKPPLPAVGVCRVCAVQVQMKQADGKVGPPERVYAAACMRTASEGMVVTTQNEPRVDTA
jgi:NADH dehydrogenase/NADH:ubiquinone oxidoreductase subunit G